MVQKIKMVIETFLKLIFLIAVSADIVICLWIAITTYRIARLLSIYDIEKRRVVLANIFNRGKIIFNMLGIGALLLSIFTMLSIIFSFDYYIYSIVSVTGTLVAGLIFLFSMQKLLDLSKYPED